MYHVLGFLPDHIGSGHTLEPGWSMFKAYAWLLLQRHKVVCAQGLDPDAPLGRHMCSAMKQIREELKPLFRYLPGAPRGKGTGKTSRRPRESIGQSEYTHQASDPDASDCDSQEDEQAPVKKWVMLRFPWQDPRPYEETLPMPSKAIPSKEMVDWQKGMMRRAYWKDTFAKTLLQNSFSVNVSDWFRFHDEYEHQTQEMIGEMMEDIGAMAKYKARHQLKSERKELAQRLAGAKGNSSWRLQEHRRLLQIKKEELDTILGSTNWEEKGCVPRGIPARVALCGLLEPPSWLRATQCIDCPESSHHSRGVGRCSLCSAPLCRYHAVLLGVPQKGDAGQRMGGGHLRCADLKPCDVRIKALICALPNFAN